MTAAKVTMYGTSWCPDCNRSKRFLEKHKIAYDWIDIEKDPKAREYVIQINHGNRSVPTIVFDDGSVLVEPSDTELGEKLGKK